MNHPFPKIALILGFCKYQTGFSSSQAVLRLMSQILDADMWAPVVVTGGIWLAVIFLLAAYVSRMWADLGGLLFLIVAPIIYKFSKRFLQVSPDSTTDDATGHSPLHPRAK